MKKSSNKYEYIDSIKGLAILGIILYHLVVFEKYRFPTLLKDILYQGRSGVELFFIISSLTLFMSYRRRINKEKFFLFNYFIRRFFRIAPLFYFFILANYFVFKTTIWSRGLSPANTPPTALMLIAAITFLNGLSPFLFETPLPGGWIITVQVGFYLIFPLLVTRVTSISSSLKALVLSLIVWNIANAILKVMLPIKAGYIYAFYASNFFIAQLPIFLCGVILYFVIEKKGKINNKKELSVILLILATLCFVYLEKIKMVLPSRFLSGIALTMFIYSQYLYPSRIIVNKFTANLGRMSYSMFFVHFYFIPYISQYALKTNNSITDFLFDYVILIFATVVASEILRRTIELPAIQVGKKIINGLLG